MNRDKVIEKVWAEWREGKPELTGLAPAHLQARNAFIAGFNARAKEQEAEIERLRAALEHYADRNHWACEVDDTNHEGACSQRLYIGNPGRAGYDLADGTLAGTPEGRKGPTGLVEGESYTLGEIMARM